MITVTIDSENSVTFIIKVNGIAMGLATNLMTAQGIQDSFNKLYKMGVHDGLMAAQSALEGISEDNV